MYNRLYKGGSNLEGGTLIQLRNLINGRNVATDISGRFNQAIDFFSVSGRFHITAAAMHYYIYQMCQDRTFLHLLIQQGTKSGAF